ncbi:DUF4350 domain-containing protein [Hymenobacter norwichensis]|uniref:DUF4350 domain-containing protein n=1 Tax=Hymenobacter norwichensis TaxID=223903 RepID=UPI0003B79E7A|nr:DUF4350 domain-containing protein [Hymenobacter norwichensis]
MTTFRWYLLGVALLFGAYVAVEYYRPKELDWTPTFQNKDKIPYGAYVLYDVLPDLLDVTTRDVHIVRVPIYNQIEGEDEPERSFEQEVTPDSSQLAADTTAEADTAQAPAESESDDADYEAGLTEAGYPRATYLFINNEFQLSSSDCRALLRHVARGNDAFIAAEQFSRLLTDTLGFNSTISLNRARRRSVAANPKLLDSVRIQLTNPRLAGQAGRLGFRLPALGAAYRLVPDSMMRGTTLATDTTGQAVLVRVPHGRGHIYLCTVPLAFTNYFALQPRTGNFAFAALSYLPTGRMVWWDEYQKQGRVGEQSLLRVLLAHDALRWALYLSVVGILLFVVVKARRRQRIIPILKPLPNTTLLFTRTIAGLYRQGNNHTAIAEKKIQLFLEHLRTRFHEPGLDLNDEAARERLAQKTGLPRPDVDALVRRINFLLTARQISDADLVGLNKAINDFRKAAS